MAITTSQPKAVAPAAFEAELVKLVAGITANLPAGTSLTVNGAPMKQAAILTMLQNWLGIWQAVDTAKSAYAGTVSARLGVTVAAKTAVKAIKAAIKLNFGAQSPLLASFGITADKASSTTSTTKVVAAAKRKATRAVRGTTSKKQKQSINVVGEPPVTVASDGSVQAGVPPINAPSSTLSSSASPTPASTAAPTPISAPAGSGSGSGTPTTGGNTPAAA